MAWRAPGAAGRQGQSRPEGQRRGAARRRRLDSSTAGFGSARLVCTTGVGQRLRRRLADCLTACLDGSPRVWLVHVWSRMIPWSHVSIDSQT